MLWLTLAAAGAGFALYVYVGRERLGAAGIGLAALRAAGLLLLLGLLGNLAFGFRLTSPPVTVALDASLSMQHGTVPWARVLDSALALAGRDGLVVRFGDAITPLDSLPPTAGGSRVAEVYRLAAARGGALVVLTDGELEDLHAVPADLRRRGSLHVLPRDEAPGLALTGLEVAPRVLRSDTIRLTLELTAWGGLEDSVALVEVRADSRVLVRRDVTVPAPAGRARRPVLLPPGTLPEGEHAVTVTVTAAHDAERRDDTRLAIVEVAALPAAVLVARRMDWEARFLARELADIVPGGIAAYGDLGGGRWVDLFTQRAVTAARVEAGLRAAAVVVSRGDVPASAAARRAWRWPADGGRALGGEWYVAGSLPTSSLVPRLAGVPWDSLPPLRDVTAADPGAGTPVLVARLGRRGAQRVVVVATDSAGRRTLTTGAAGFWRWAFRGGASREAYRTLLAAGIEWLLEGTGRDREAPVIADRVVPRGVPVTFRWVGSAEMPDSTRVEFAGPDSSGTAVLVWGPDGRAAVPLGPGVYRWRVPGLADAGGIAAVEAYSPEFVPRAPVAATSGAAPTHAARVGLRDVWWMFVLAIAALVTEWAWRIRRGLP